MAASGTGKSAGQRALTQRRRNRTLPAIEVPRVEDQDLTRAIGNIAEHLRIYEGDVAAPKERFITLQELEDTGLIESKTKGGYAYISRILSKDVAQKSGSTANPTLKGTVRKDTALGPRTAGGGGGGSQNPIEQGKRGLIQKLSDIENVVVQSPAQADFLYYDGGKWKNFSLFKRNNKWTGRNTFVNTTTFSGTVSFSSVTAVDYIDFTPQTTAPAHEEGRLFYDAGNFAMSYYNDEADVTVNLGQEVMLRVRNTTGSLIANGAAVYINGAQGANLPTIALAQADALATSEVIGLATHDIENNSNGYVTTLGSVRDLDTSSFSAGDELFLSPSVAGGLTATKPTSDFVVPVGYVLIDNPATGEIKVTVHPHARRGDLTSASQNETVSGAWTFSNSIDFTKAAVAGQYGSTINIYSGNPQVSFHDTGAAADEGAWNIIGGVDTLKFRVLSDDFATAVDVMTFNRGTGATIADVKFDVEVTGADSANVGSFNASHASGGTLLKSGNYVAMGNHYSSQRTWIGNNVYVDPADAVSSQARTAVTHGTYGHTILEMAAGQFWFYGDSASVTAGDIVTKQLIGYMYESGGVANLELGIESTTIGGQLRLHGTTASKTSELQTTNGNLHIDSAAGSQVYLNYYSNTGSIYMGAAGGFKATMTGQYGAVQTVGSTGGYGGISLDGNFALMNSGSAHVGLYNDVNNEWMIIAYPNSYVGLYYNGVVEFQTQDSNAAGNSTGAQVKNFNGTFYDVGMNVMPRFRTNVSFTLTDQDCGGYMYHSNSTVYTITLNNSSGGGADFPIGGTFFVLNYGTGNVTVNTGSGTLYSPQLGTGTTGSRTIGGNSVATILKYAADSWFVWGDAIS